MRLVELAGREGVDTPAILRLLGRVRSHAPDAVLTCADRGAGVVIVEGWAARVRDMADGRRQIISFRLPGDTIFDLRPRGWSSSTVVALTSLRVVGIGDLCAHLDRHAGGLSALSSVSMDSAQDEERHILDHVVRLGLQNAVQRMAHLFLEIDARLKTVGLSDGKSFDLPIRQDHLGEALGMTLVHVNRTLQRLRAEGAIELRGGRLTMLQPGQLARIAGLV